MTRARTPQDTDAELISKIRGGDTRAFSLIVDRHKERGMALAFRMLRNKEEAEEALQDAFIRAFKGLASFEMRSSFSTWFFRIVYNVCATKLSRRGDLQKQTELDAETIERTAAPEPLPDKVLENEQTEAFIREEIERLPEAYGTAFTLFALHERTYDEIAEITDAALGTVKARIFRARALLRDAVASRLMRMAEKKRKEQAA